MPNLTKAIEQIRPGLKVMNDCCQVYLRGSDMVVCDEFSHECVKRVFVKGLDVLWGFLESPNLR